VMHWLRGESVSLTLDQISVSDLVRVLWQGKFIIVSISALFVAAAIVLALITPNKYRSEVVLAPATELSGARSAGGIGGLAALTGINLSAGGEHEILAISLLGSRGFLVEFVERHGLLPQLMAVESWDLRQNELVFNPEVYDVSTNEWVRKAKFPLESKPSDWEIYLEVSRIVKLNKDDDSGYIVLSVDHQSPYVAEQWLQLLVEDINQYVRDRDIASANESITFLQKKLSETSASEMKVVFFGLIEEQTKKSMLADVNEDYVFKVVDPPYISLQPISPNRKLLVVLGGFFGGCISILILLLLALWRGRKTLTNVA